AQGGGQRDARNGDRRRRTHLLRRADLVGQSLGGPRSGSRQRRGDRLGLGGPHLRQTPEQGVQVAGLQGGVDGRRPVHNVRAPGVLDVEVLGRADRGDGEAVEVDLAGDENLGGGGGGGHRYAFRWNPGCLPGVNRL